jgi:predicted ATPase
VILEQPELHLHPAAHGDLAELFVESVFRNDNKYIIETHSENILLRLRKLIVDENSPLTSEDVIIYWIDSDEEEHNVKEITINENGVLSDWPDGVFNENHDEIIAIKKMLKMKKQKNDSTN